MGLLTVCLAAPGFAQPLVPLGDDVDQPLLPAGIARADVEMFGELAHLWKDADGFNVVHIIGDFALHAGRRRLAAREAVIWLTPAEYEGVAFYHLEIVLWRDATVREPSGTVTRGPALFVTLNAQGTVRTSADEKSNVSSEGATVFTRALRIREALRQSVKRDDFAGSITTIDLNKAASADEPQARPPVSYTARETSYEEVDGRSVITAIRDVYLFRGATDTDDAVEIRADAAVVYLRQDSTADAESLDEADADRPGRAQPGVTSEGGGMLDDATGGSPDLGFAGQGEVESVYLEGHVVLASGERTIQATRLYYDFAHDRALVLDPVLRMFDAQRDLPIVLRAQQVRQLSQREFTARKAVLTTSEFATPHYHVGAEQLRLIDRTRRGLGVPAVVSESTGTAQVKHSTFNLANVPLLYWPYAKADISGTETSIESVRTGYSDTFGVEMETRWSLFNILGLEKPPGVDGSLQLDYFSERGPGVGVDFDYRTDNAFGLFRGYYIRDEGQDGSVGQWDNPEPPSPDRGRALLRHRQYLPKDWELTFELSYISDRNFLREYYESEFKEDKDQESLLYLKKQVDNWAFTAQLQYHVLNFVTTTERLPEFAFRLIGEPVGSALTFFSENRAGWVRYRPADRNIWERIVEGGHEHDSGATARGDSRQEIELPFALGDLKIVPFGSIRGTAWDDTPDGGGQSRAFGTYGLRGSLYAWKVYPDAQSDLFDISGIRHIVKADVVAWGSHTSLEREELHPFDEPVEEIDDVNGVSFGLRQRWQTKRGGPDRRRIVDVLTLDLEVGAFDHNNGHDFTNGFVSYSRPENSIARNYANASLNYRINDVTSIVSELNYDINDGEIDVFNLSYGVQRTPRLSYLIGYRYIEEMDSNLLGAGLNYQINEKYTLAIREEFDIARGQTAEFDVGIIRRFPRWYVAVTFALDEVEDDFGVSVSAWPEGLPQAALGNRRFTGLATSTEIRP